MTSKPLVQHFQDDLNDVVDKYRDEGLTLSEAVGALELTKLDLHNESGENNGDF
jgi:hypothetical protein